MSILSIVIEGLIGGSIGVYAARILSNRLHKKEEAINQEIRKIQKEQYNDYAGERYWYLKSMHYDIWNTYGSKKFLKFLQSEKENNPKPVYKY